MYEQFIRIILFTMDAEDIVVVLEMKYVLNNTNIADSKYTKLFVSI